MDDPYPQQEPPLICEICDQPIEGFWHRNIGGGAVCAACCPICENKRVADAARLAAPDIETVFRLYGHIQTHPLPNLRALLDMLTPPAPKWTANEPDSEGEKDQGDEDAHRPIGLFNYRSYRQ